MYISIDSVACESCTLEQGGERKRKRMPVMAVSGINLRKKLLFSPGCEELAAMNPQAYMGARVCGGASGATSQLTVIQLKSEEAI